ncbi:hypothetical protein WA026_005891 [Henosepilachna vigintioctopunctata]|uniref:Uncharacterized protein n=1 Tax=Henosepilachna vigintioctopunctata TaxID=420089 RepID=A0AAW1TU45_9CUCU
MSILLYFASASCAISFIWDTLSHVVKHLPEAKRLDLLQNLTDLLQKTFSSQFVFPALGHDDPGSRKKMSDMWSRWFPADSLKTFISGGYYIIERKTLKLQIVVLNTNLMKKSENDAEAARQWDWLESVLQKFYKNGETVTKLTLISHESRRRLGYKTSLTAK